MLVVSVHDTLRAYRTAFGTERIPGSQSLMTITVVVSTVAVIVLLFVPVGMLCQSATGGVLWP